MKISTEILLIVIDNSVDADGHLRLAAAAERHGLALAQLSVLLLQHLKESLRAHANAVERRVRLLDRLVKFLAQHIFVLQ